MVVEKPEVPAMVDVSEDPKNTSEPK